MAALANCGHRSASLYHLVSEHEYRVQHDRGWKSELERGASQ